MAPTKNYTMNDLAGFFLDFRKEFDEFRHAMVGFKEDAIGFQQDMIGFKQEMVGFKKEMVGFKLDSLSFQQETSNRFTSLETHLNAKIDHVFVTLREDIDALSSEVLQVRKSYLRRRK